MARDVVQEMHLHKAEIWFVNKMLRNILLGLRCIFINVPTLCSCEKIVPSWATLPFFMVVQSMLLFYGFWDLLWRFTGTESTEIILLTMKLLQILLYIVDCHFSMVLVLCHKVKSNYVLDSQQGICEEYPLAVRRVWKNHCQNWKIMHPGASISSRLQCMPWLYDLLSRAKLVYGGIITQRWFNVSILEYCSRKNVTQSIKCFSIPREKVWGISCTILVVWEMYFIFQTAPSEAPTTWSSRYFLHSHLSVSFPQPTNIIFTKYGR